MQRGSLALVSVCLFCLVGIAQANWERMDPNDGRLRLHVGELIAKSVAGLAEGYELQTIRDTGSVFYCELGWWGFQSGNRYKLQGDFCWTDDRGGWDYSKTVPVALFRTFGEIDNSFSRTGAEEGPTISTVLGDIRTLAFDVDRDNFGETSREYIGFAQGFNAKTTQTWQHYKKVLYLYACGKNGLRMSEKRFLELLSGFSIEGEFEALVK